jgi:hypothetical protein
MMERIASGQEVFASRLVLTKMARADPDPCAL